MTDIVGSNVQILNLVGTWMDIIFKNSKCRPTNISVHIFPGFLLLLKKKNQMKYFQYNAIYFVTFGRSFHFKGPLKIFTAVTYFMIPTETKHKQFKTVPVLSVKNCSHIFNFTSLGLLAVSIYKGSIKPKHHINDTYVLEIGIYHAFFPNGIRK